MSLEDMLKFVEAKESGKRSASRLPTKFQRGKQLEATRDQRTQPDIRDRTPVICSYCGGKGHGRRAPLHARGKEFPAYDHICSHCSKKHHFEGVCLSKDNKNHLAIVLSSVLVDKRQRRWMNCTSSGAFTTGTGHAP